MTISGASSRASEWDKRIRRASELGGRFPESAEILGFYGRVLEFQQGLSEQIAAQIAAADPSTELRRQIDVGILLPYLESLLSLVERHRPRTLAEKAREIRPQSDEEKRALLNNFLTHSEDTPHDGSVFFARALLQPYAEWLAAAYPAPAPGSAGNACYACHGRPQAGVLRPEGDGGKRFLLCSFCLTEWEFRRVLCPMCGEADYQKLPRFSAEDIESIRVEACDTCHYYIKSIDMTVDGLAVPLVDDVAAVALDLWAVEQGYKKAAPNLMGF